MRKLNKWTSLVPIGAFAIAMAACSDQSPTEVQPQLEPTAASHAIAAATVTIYPGKYTLDIGQVKQLVAIPRDARGNTLSLRYQPIVWSSSNPGVATVSSTGRVVARSGGVTYIKATYGGVSRRAAITVRAAARAASINITASATKLRVGTYAQLTATAKDASGDPVAVPLTWRSSNTSAIRVYSNGLIKAVGAGTSTVSVSGGGVTDRISISAGSTSTAPSTSDGSTSDSPATNVASVAVFPRTYSLSVGLAKQFIALPRDRNGSTIGGKTVVWRSSNTSVATVTSRGIVYTRGAGTATISATVDGVVGRSSLTVTR